MKPEEFEKLKIGDHVLIEHFCYGYSIDRDTRELKGDTGPWLVEIIAKGQDAIEFRHYSRKKSNEKSSAIGVATISTVLHKIHVRDSELLK